MLPTSPTNHSIAIARHPWLKWRPTAVGMVTFLLIATPLMIAAWNMYSQADEILQEKIHDQLVSAAQVISQVIDAEVHEKLNKAELDHSPEYDRQVQRMKAVKNAVDPGLMIKFTYTCILDGKDVRFVLDTTADGDKDQDGRNDRAKLLEVYEHPSPTLRKVLESGLARVDEVPYSDRWGTFKSSYAPIFNSKLECIAAVGVDMSLDDFELHRSGLRKVASLSVVGMLFLAYIAGAWMAWYHRRLQTSVAELVRTSDAAAAAERVKADFLGAMSHELRTPLNAVLGMSEMLEQTALDAKQREMLNTISKSGESLLATLTSILEFSQLDSRRSGIEPEEASLKSLLHEVIHAHEEELRTKGLTMTEDIAKDCPGRFTGHVPFLRQVLSQLLSNAIKFTDKGGVTIRVRAITEGEGGSLHFAIHDSGIGIRAEHLPHLFEPLFQVDGSTTRRHGGTGIGLALCKRLCDAMDGRLWVESELGRGSTFHLQVKVGHFTEEPAPALKPEALLWVDDSMKAMLATRVLEKMGTKVASISSLEELLHRPNLGATAYCIIDAQVVSGVVLTEIRSLIPSAHIIVLHNRQNPTGYEAADVILDSTFKPADLRKALE